MNELNIEIDRTDLKFWNSIETNITFVKYG